MGEGEAVALPTTINGTIHSLLDKKEPHEANGRETGEEIRRPTTWWPARPTLAPPELLQCRPSPTTAALSQPPPSRCRHCDLPRRRRRRLRGSLWRPRTHRVGERRFRQDAKLGTSPAFSKTEVVVDEGVGGERGGPGTGETAAAEHQPERDARASLASDEADAMADCAEEAMGRPGRGGGAILPCRRSHLLPSRRPACPENREEKTVIERGGRERDDVTA
ncbi:Os06g0225600 [Oryza sativa Japonica Group]|uniref:Os06g0225600 protein n=2 Tax=Oryza sativa subsp. japonica TaxID=39947 RepID=A0A0N7KLS9_ORYSJ|nr:hypothetical protein OsJ_20661 [Oryza sativa Japonica Group]KAB8101804.1 hypothetical protein EE612_032813 [Oryza sativa]BAD37291.1 unknown protein [Oryza sativa Japonica Group]BAF19112.1 Os06g0225600 [Oryza sativa Japonica Group]BAS96865.1 Os06g0225600 [Oryza sativa Japonica Group]|eukprot:NP_001057198.1 Os06g0225600 [Oryza sativa Japonica Group]